MLFWSRKYIAVEGRASDQYKDCLSKYEDFHYVSSYTGKMTSLFWDGPLVIPVRTRDSKAHGANMGPTWVLSALDGPHVGPMNLAIRDQLDIAYFDIRFFKFPCQAYIFWFSFSLSLAGKWSL